MAIGDNGAENLGDRRYVTVILRLLVNRSRYMERGEIVDTAGAPRGYFTDWRELIAGLQRFLEQDVARDA